MTQRDGSFLVAKNPEPDFKWEDTAGKHILAGRKGGMPAMTLEYVMNQAGVDTSGSNFDTTVQFDVMVGAFEGNNACDYCTMFEPTASEFQAAGKGYIVASVGEASGFVPYTAFSAKKSYIAENKDTVTDFLRAIVRGYNYIKENDAETVAKALEKSFSGTPLDSIAAAIKNYSGIDAWCHSPVMKEADFVKLQDIMENAGELSGRADFSVAVDNSIANIVAAELL
nr:ABC transporter substrate-binding protein [Pumilibacter muris]